MNSCGRCANDTRRATRRPRHQSDMKVEMEKTADEVKRLQSCINDLISVLALAAIWSGSESCQMLGTLLDSLLAILRLDFSCARLNDSIDGSPVEVVRLAQRQHPSAQPQEVGRALGRWLTGDHTASRFVVPNPAGEGEVSIASFSLGLQDEVGVLVAGSRRADFPTDIERLLLRVAANQAAIGLQEARRAGDQKRVAEALERRVAERTSQLTAVNEELRRSQAYLAEAQRLSQTGSFGWRLSTGEILWSEETFRIFQCDRTTTPTVELILQRVHPEDAALVRQTIERASHDGKDFEHEYRLVMPDGAIKHVNVVARALNDESDGIEFVGAVMDVSDRKRAEEALRRSEGYLAEAQRLTGTGSWAWNVASRRSVYWSQENYRLFGFDPEGGIPSDEAFYQRVHPEDLDRVRREAFLERPEEGSHFDVVFRIVLPGGEIKYIRSTGHPVRNVSGDILEYVGTTIDVTERKRADEERERLLASERAAFAESVAAQQRFRDLVNSVEGIVWEADVPSFQFLFISKQAERVLGYPVERWLSEPTFWKDHVHPDDRDWALQFCQSATTEKRDHEFEYRMIAADGSVVWLRDLVTVVVEGDRVTRLRGVMVDLTKRKQAEEALRQAQADLAHVSRVTTMGELTASLAHEVNQPIAAAVTNANTSLRWLAANPPNVEEARAAATRIVIDGRRAGEIISRIRLLFKKGTPQHDLVDVNEVIGEMIVLLRGETTRYSISVRTELAADLPQVRGDRVQLLQVMMNLIMNGIDAMKDADGTRELAIKSQRTENEQLLVSVSDTGVGLPPQQADQIFNAFFTTKPNGTGMGLRISRSIVESHGGRLWAADNSPRGASFHLTLPTKAEAHE